jgi:hypothetical protein
MAYRDDLTAAYARIDALERELHMQRMQRKVAAPTVPFDVDVDDPFSRHDNGWAEITTVVRTPYKKIWMPVTFSASGMADETKSIYGIPNALFHGEELFAYDTAERPGHGTEITDIFVGQKRQLCSGVPTWLFYEWLSPQCREVWRKEIEKLDSPMETEATRKAAASLRIANAAARLSWDNCEKGLSIMFKVHFLETCKWEGVLWGWGLRE